MLDCDHTRRFLDSDLARGSVDDSLLRDLTRHVSNCEPCRHRLSRSPQHLYALERYRSVVSRVARRLDAAAEGELAAVACRLAELRSLPASERSSALELDPGRRQMLLLADALLDESRASLPESPAEARSWAEAAEILVRSCDPPDVAQLARAVACRGDAERALGDLDLAHQTLEAARDLLLESATPLFRLDAAAEFHMYFGALYRDLRRFDDALEHLTQAAHLYHDATLDAERSRVWMMIRNIHAGRGDLPEALKADYTALINLDKGTDPQLYLTARLNLAHDLVEAGHHKRSLDVLLYDEELYAAHADAELRRTWLFGRIAAAIGDPDQAAELFRAVRAGFASRANGFEAALVSLDLALLCLRKRRSAALRTAVDAAFRLFAAHEVHPQALTALRLLIPAASGSAAETGIRQAIVFLRQAQREPRRLERPS